MNNAFRYDSLSEIRQLLETHDLSMNKRFGQNFLLSPGVRERIIQTLDTDQYRTYWEVGPGIGALTHDVIDRVDALTLFEIDRGFIRILREFFGDRPSFSIVEGDVLKSWPEYLAAHEVPDVIFGNLPYNIGAQCIASFIEAGCLAKKMVFTLQKEVVERMGSPAGSKQYSSFTILCAIDYEVRHLFDIQPGSFYPVPDVVSSVVTMTRREQPLVAKQDRVLFMKMVRQLFAQRRKTILNNLSGCSGFPNRTKADLSVLLEGHGFDPKLRIEQLDLQRLVELFSLMV